MYVFALIEMICRVLSAVTRMKTPRRPAHSIITAITAIMACPAGPGHFGSAPDGGSRDFPFPRRLHHLEATKRGAGRPPWWNGHLRGSFR